MAAGGAEDIRQGPDIEPTLDVWRARAPRALSAEDARVIIRNVTGFFGILAQWEAVERTATNSPPSRARRPDQ
jgi:hypothetical protein